MFANWSTRDIATWALILGGFSLIVQGIAYVVTRPRLALQVVGAKEIYGSENVGTGTSLNLSLLNEGRRPALVSRWDVLRERTLLTPESGGPTHWLLSPQLPDTAWTPFILGGGHKRNWTVLLQPEGSPGNDPNASQWYKVDPRPEWADVDFVVGYKPFFFWGELTMSQHFVLKRWDPTSPVNLQRKLDNAT